mmetsp:Transcript_8872/g.11882  ORF Transcript_8872/g.11882 Transcript_8872/m.11882 type:complete len:126 (+) Transcript_8872:310-687(+)
MNDMSSGMANNSGGGMGQSISNQVMNGQSLPFTNANSGKKAVHVKVSLTIFELHRHMTRANDWHSRGTAWLTQKKAREKRDFDLGHPCYVKTQDVNLTISGTFPLLSEGRIPSKRKSYPDPVSLV